ncbi:hypothetical protein KUTeg_009172 [Tegillarca granosa]|uniref:TLDc domain-containing protein n=1 Tax=Tegillarca granosa TaxID=220873 RepID=A0ABQ9FAF6_TEGGR|nr:hypothetical protein KUTeg_009172 [Tegillarca granosa]
MSSDLPPVKREVEHNRQLNCTNGTSMLTQSNIKSMTEQLDSRFQILPNTFGKTMAKLLGLSDRDKLLIEAWIGKRKTFNLLYRASSDGFSAKSFHKKCDNKGPTVTVLFNKDKSMYGGYTSIGWTTAGKYMKDDKAFIFRLYHNGLLKPTNFPVKLRQGCQGCGYLTYSCHSYGRNYNFSDDMTVCSRCGSNYYRCASCGGQYEFNICGIYDNSSYGPTFGNSTGHHDLQTFTGTISKQGDYFPLNGSMDFGKAFDARGQTAKDINNSNFNVTELLVYSLTDMTDDEIKTKSKTLGRLSGEGLVLEQLTDYIENYKPYKRLDVTEARVVMIGAVGAGKSSFLNTITSVFKGRICNKAASGSVMNSLTTMLRMYQIEDSQCSNYMNFRICDTRGLEEDQGVDGEELGYLLDGHIPDRYQFNPSVPFNPDVPGFVAYPALHQKIHCVVFVVDGSAVEVMSEKVIEKIKILQKKVYQRGISQVVLLTKIDKICPEVEDNISKTFNSLAIKDAVDKVSQTMGIPRASVLPIKNYEQEGELDDNISILALYSLKQILNFADDYMSNIYEKLESQQAQDSSQHESSEKYRKSKLKE